MRDSLPTLQDVKRLMFKQQRKKNLIPEHAALTNELNSEILRLREKWESEASQPEKIKLETQLHEQLATKYEVEEQYFLSLREKLENYILDQPQRIRLRESRLFNRKITTFNKRRSTQLLFDRYCAMRLGDSFHVRTTGRDQTIRILLDTLQTATGSKDSPAKRALFKFDIKDFFGSMEHDFLLSKIQSNAGVPTYVNKHIRSIVAAYERLYGTDVGIPQGVPMSSILSEIYLENFDNKLKRDRGVALYLRYVDDIVVICNASEQTRIVELVQAELRGIGLSINDSKGFTQIVHPAEELTSFDYLGYCFTFSEIRSQLVAVDISERKMQRLLGAIDNLVAYSDKITCWADAQKVNFFLLISEYLFLPHASEPKGDGLRIVTGLAYSARFIQGDRRKQHNFRRVFNIAQGKISQLLSRVRSESGWFCQCCKNKIHRSDELSRFAEIYLKQTQVMGSPARQHATEYNRKKIRGILWS